MDNQDPRKENHKNQPRVSGRFVKDSSNPSKARVSLRVNAKLLEEFKKKYGTGFSGQLAKIVEVYMEENLD